MNTPRLVRPLGARRAIPVERGKSDKLLGAALLWAALAASFPYAALWAASLPDTASQVAPPADLPPAAVVVEALAAQPAVRAAQAELRGAQAEHGLLRAGPHEYGLNLSSQRRSLNGGPDYLEWGLALERGLRLPGKAGLDDRIGAQGVLAAAERIGDARHESARELLGLWYGVRQARLESALWRQQAELLGEQKRVVETRVKRGDAARLETLQAEAAQAQAQAQGAAATAREEAAQARLRARFPELPAPDDQETPPQAPAGNLEQWQALTLEHNHELLAIQRRLDQARLRTQRAEADRLPDPTLAMHLASEQGGNDKIVGVSLSLPLPGAARQAQTRMRLAEAEALVETETATRRRLAAEAAVNWRQAVAGMENWRRLEEAARAIGRHAELARRAHALGELGLSEALLAQRAALDARLAAGQARLTANEAIARLLLDAHQLWPAEAEH